LADALIRSASQGFALPECLAYAATSRLMRPLSKPIALTIYLIIPRLGGERHLTAMRHGVIDPHMELRFRDQRCLSTTIRWKCGSDCH
jgi:hypothetical protein